MALDRVKQPLQDLLRLVVFDRSTTKQRASSRISIPFPSSTFERLSIEPGASLLLSIEEGLKYEACLGILVEEQADGDLEYLKRNIPKQRLDEVVVSAWISKADIRRSDLVEIAKRFVSDNARPKREWSVAWEIDRLSIETSQSFSVAGVEFFRLDDVRATYWFGEYRPDLSVFETTTMGKSFACVKVSAGSADKAIERARPVIIDAVDVLRQLLSRDRWAWPQALGQSIGDYRMARPQVEVTGAYWGASKEGFWINATVSDQLLEGGPVHETEKEEPKNFREYAIELSYPFDPKNKSRLSDRLARSTVLAGTSYSRLRTDDALLDLCVALETLLATNDDRFKAEAIAARYWLLLAATNVAAANVHPFELFDLYLLRNDVVHGSDRNVSTEHHINRLRFAADSTIDSVRELMIEDTQIRNSRTLFSRLQRPEYIRKALAHQDFDDPRSAPTAVAKMMKMWLGVTASTYDGNISSRSEDYPNLRARPAAVDDEGLAGDVA